MSDQGVEVYALPEPVKEGSVLWSAVVAILAATVLLAGLLTVLTDDDVDPIELLTAAPGAAQDAGTARIEMAMEVDGGIGMDMSAEGLIDFETGASTMTMSLLGNEMEMRTVDQHIYMRLPELGRPPGLTTSWIGMPVTVAGPGSYTGSPNAAGMIDALRGMSDEIEELGEEEVNGHDATGFRVNVDLARALEQAPESERARLQDSLAQMEAAGMRTWPMEVWVNDAKLPVRIIMEIHDVGGTGADMRMQMDYLDFGIPVDIEPPPADDTVVVQDQAELQELLAGAPAA